MPMQLNEVEYSSTLSCNSLALMGVHNNSASSSGLSNPNLYDNTHDYYYMYTSYVCMI